MNELPAKEQILALASTHDVHFQATDFDAWADKVTELADDDIALNSIELTLLELDRRGFISSKDAIALLGKYHKENADAF